MQTANCNLRLNGDINNEIFKASVTPAEIVIFRAIHGSDSVVNVQPTGSDKRSHGPEFERLKQTYGEKIVSSVFPGSFPQLPVNLKDIGIDVYAAAPRGKGKVAAEAAEADAEAGE